MFHTVYVVYNIYPLFQSVWGGLLKKPWSSNCLITCYDQYFE